MKASSASSEAKPLFTQSTTWRSPSSPDKAIAVYPAENPRLACGTIDNPRGRLT